MVARCAKIGSLATENLEAFAAYKCDASKVDRVQYKTARKIVNAPRVQSGQSTIIPADTNAADLLKAA